MTLVQRFNDFCNNQAPPFTKPLLLSIMKDEFTRNLFFSQLISEGFSNSELFHLKFSLERMNSSTTVETISLKNVIKYQILLDPSLQLVLNESSIDTLTIDKVQRSAVNYIKQRLLDLQNTNTQLHTLLIKENGECFIPRPTNLKFPLLFQIKIIVVDTYLIEEFSNKHIILNECNVDDLEFERSGSIIDNIISDNDSSPVTAVVYSNFSYLLSFLEKPEWLPRIHAPLLENSESMKSVNVRIRKALMQMLQPYTKNSVPYTRSVLVYGPPGTGSIFYLNNRFC